MVLYNSEISQMGAGNLCDFCHFSLCRIGRIRAACRTFWHYGRNCAAYLDCDGDLDAPRLSAAVFPYQLSIVLSCNGGATFYCAHTVSTYERDIRICRRQFIHHNVSATRDAPHARMVFQSGVAVVFIIEFYCRSDCGHHHYRRAFGRDYGVDHPSSGESCICV